jgi:excisionase family DNA binding protein
LDSVEPIGTPDQKEEVMGQVTSEQPTPAEEVTYRVKEVAPILNVCVATVYNLIASGDLPAYSIGPGRGTKRVPHAELMAYKERCRARAVRTPA